MRGPTPRSTLPHSGDFARLSRDDLPVDTIALARYLIGCSIVAESEAGIAAGRITETEAYLEGDAAAHSFRGKTPRNASLFLERGHAYVYFIYGNHFCLNVSGDREGVGAGVLLRAAEPLVGLSLMRMRRNGVRDRDLLRGPGRLASAFGIDRKLDGLDLTQAGPLWLAASSAPAEIGETVRIGITKESARVLRFYARDTDHISGPKSLR